MCSVIYGLLDDDGITVRYIGSTSHDLKSRLHAHWYQRHNTNSPVRLWLQSRSTMPTGIQFEECDTKDEAKIEAKWIIFFGLDNLLNVIPGGYKFNGTNYQLDPVSRARQVAAAKKALTGRTMSDETKARISAANTGKKRTLEARQKMRQAKLGRPLTDEHRQKLSEAHRGIVHTAEARANMSAAQQGKQVSDETREKLRQAWVRRKARMA